MPVAEPLAVPDTDREQLRSWVRSRSMPSDLVMRARIVLLAAEGVPNAEIGRRLGVSRQAVVAWRGR
jgi:DNA-binding NarL/FixJ family response regulator